MNRTPITSTAARLLLTTLLGSGLLLGTAGLAQADRGNDNNRERWEERQQRHDHQDHRQTVQARPSHREVVVRELPRRARRTEVGKNLYYRDGDHFYSRRANGFVRVSPPAGVVVARLPVGFLRIDFGGGSYYRFEDVYYRPVRGGFLVVDPITTGLVRPAADTVRVVATLLNVRSGPGERYGVVGMVRYGEVLPVSGAAPGWHRVVLPDGRSGWIMSRFASCAAAG